MGDPPSMRVERGMNFQTLIAQQPKEIYKSDTSDTSNTNKIEK
jgi:hypothetical protein